jgi:hypothetical protein
MSERPLANPYRPFEDDDVSTGPFAGRLKAFEFLYQQVTNPLGAQTSIVLGRAAIGKTALLRQFNRYFDESFIGVYLALRERRIRSEADLLRALAEEATAALTERNFSLSRLSETQPPDDAVRAWFSEDFLPDVFHIIRKRRLVYLLDDAGTLTQAAADGRLPQDIFAYLHERLRSSSGLGFVLAMDQRYEDQIPAMSPLVGLTDSFRLSALLPDEAAWLLREPVRGVYHVTDEGVEAANRAAGGEPRLLQNFGYELYQRWLRQPDEIVMQAEDVKQVSTLVARQNDEAFARQWHTRSRNERLALTAITSLVYDDPLGAIAPETVQAWLIDSDYTLDLTSVHAALRALEYDEMIEASASGLRVKTGLMQTWLLDNARMNQSAAPAAGGRRLRWAALALLVLLAAVLVLIVTQSGAPTAPGEATAEPTVTLVR